MSIHNTIKPIYYVSRLFLLWPFKYGTGKVMVQLSIFEKIIAHIINLLLLMLICWGYYEKLIYKMKGKIKLSPNILELIFLCPIHFFGCFSVVWANTYQGKHAIQFFKNLELIDSKKLHIPYKVHNSMRYKTLQKTILQISLSFLLCGSDCFITSTMFGFSKGRHYLMSYYNYIRVIVVVQQVSNKAEFVRTFYKILNKHLEDVIRKIKYLKRERSNNVHKSTKFIRKLRSAHSELWNLINLNATIHGLQLFLIFCCLTSMVLFTLYYGLLYGATNHTYKSKVGYEKWIAVISICTFLKQLVNMCQ